MGNTDNLGPVKPRFLRREAAAEFVGVSRETFRLMVRAGRVRTYWPSPGCPVFDVRELEALVLASAR
jgi:hypothetical protein